MGFLFMTPIPRFPERVAQHNAGQCTPNFIFSMLERKGKSYSNTIAETLYGHIGCGPQTSLFSASNRTQSHTHCAGFSFSCEVSATFAI